MFLIITAFMSFKKLCNSPGPPRGRGRGGGLPQGLGVKGTSSINIEILCKAYLDVFKEPPNRSSLKGFKSASRFSSPRLFFFLPLLLASITDTMGFTLQLCPWASKTSRRPCNSLPINRFLCIVDNKWQT